MQLSPTILGLVNADMCLSNAVITYSVPRKLIFRFSNLKKGSNKDLLRSIDIEICNEAVNE